MSLKNQFEVLNEIIWHDGVLLEARTIGNATRFDFVLVVDIYEDERATIRTKKIIHFIDIENLKVEINVSDLLDNKNAGNIESVLMTSDDGREKFSMRLFGGLLCFSFKHLNQQTTDYTYFNMR